jgi:alkylation response protein AidB-like acyl-CoA dehydrogenase
MIGHALEPTTAPGAATLRRADPLLARIAERAHAHDADRTYVEDNMADLAAAGVLGACAPTPLGGADLRSLHDVMVVVSRLSRSCASTGLAASMHMTAIWGMARRWEQAEGPSRARAEQVIELFVAGPVLVAGASTEPGSNWCIPMATATPVNGGYLLNGRKSFVTKFNAAGAGSVNTTVQLEIAGRPHRASAAVLVGTPGMTVHADWDGLGLRGSGSVSVSFEDCFVPEASVSPGSPLGRPTAEDLVVTSSVNFPLLGTYLGIVEAAAAEVTSVVGKQRRHPAPGTSADRPDVQREVGEMAAALVTLRSILGRCGAALDQAVDAGPRSIEEADSMMAEWQAGKVALLRCAVDAVDRAMIIVGGGAYRSSSTLARLVRDVRAGWFMQPWSALDAPMLVGRTELGLDPYPDLTAETCATRACGR